MRYRYYLPCALLTLLVLSILAGCATPKPKAVEPLSRSGEEMLRESQGIAQMGERWLEGKKKVQEGEEMVRQGQARIDAGQRMIDEGRRVMKESEAGYQGIKK